MEVGLFFSSSMKESTVPAISSTVHFGLSTAIQGFLLPTGEFRYGANYVSKLLGHSGNYLLRATKNRTKKLKALRRKGFTGYQIKVKVNNVGRGSTYPLTISFDDFCIWVEFEALEVRNPKAIALLTTSFREILRTRTQEAFKEVTGQEPDSYEKRLVQFEHDFEERERILQEDREELDGLALYGDDPQFDEQVLLRQLEARYSDVLLN